MQSNSKALNSVRLFRTASHRCSYKTDEQAATVFVDPDLVIDKSLNSKLSELGYRRSGAHLYRPDCEFCQACISCRIPVASYRMSRSQRRVMRRNQHLRVVEESDLTCSDAFDLYRRYIDERHGDGDMYPATLEQYEAFIKTKTVDTRFYLFYEQDRLVAVSVVDLLEHGLSAVYTFFDPRLKNLSLGKFAILWQIQKCQDMGLPYLFLGYWIRNCPKMQYKSSFRPLEMLLNGRWVLIK